MKEIMVDLDNTLVNFTKMLFNNIEMNFNIHFDEKDVITYNFSDLFYKKGCSKEEIYKFFNTTYSDKTLYTDQLIISEHWDKILYLISEYKKQGYKIVCHTKASSDEMIYSKKCFFNNKLKNVFDDIIIEYIEGKKAISSVKDIHYDIIIDDSPYIIEHYLNNNSTGIVIMPLTLYNKFLLKEPKYQNRIQIL